MCIFRINSFDTHEKETSGGPMQMVDPIVIGKKNQQNLNFKLH